MYSLQLVQFCAGKAIHDFFMYRLLKSACLTSKDRGIYFMAIIELFLVAIGLSMDAFAISVCKGLELRGGTVKDGAVIGGYFGVFQALMPLIGYTLGVRFSSAIIAYDHWVAFFLLSIIGAKMLYESLKREPEKATENCDTNTSVKTMLPLAIATSIDALAVGVSFAFLSVNIVPAVLLIGITTFVLSVIGFKIGGVFGDKFKSTAEFTGGLILIVMGFKILLEHTGIFTL